MPDRIQYPNCFSWYWSLSVFSRKTRALWNPLNIDPELSDIDLNLESVSLSEDEGFRKHHPSNHNQGDKYEIELDPQTLFGEESKLMPSEGYFQMSHISNQKSNSANSNIQDYRSLVARLENDASNRSIQKTRQEPSEQQKNQVEAKKVSSMQIQMPGFESTSKLLQEKPDKEDPADKMRPKVVPKNTGSQLNICEWVSKSIEQGLLKKWKGRASPDCSAGLSHESTQITRVKSKSQNSQFSQKRETSKIEIASNYSFVHDHENAFDPSRKMLETNWSFAQNAAPAEAPKPETLRPENAPDSRNSEETSADAGKVKEDSCATKKIENAESKSGFLGNATEKISKHENYKNPF